MREESCVARLAKFFPSVTPVRLPVRVSASAMQAETVIEYGTPGEVLFSCSLPLEFGDQVDVRNQDGTFAVDAVVVAVQLHGDQTAVAARFLHEVPNWIVK